MTIAASRRRARTALLFACCVGACSRTLPYVADAAEPSADASPDEAAPPGNGCGGSSALAQAPGDACGLCGRWVCAGPDALACDDRERRNACGTCGPTPDEVCNDRDDDCDGVVDEGCARRITVLREDETRVRVSGDLAAIETSGAGAMYLARFSDGSRERLPEPRFDGAGRRSLRDVSLDGNTVAFAQERESPDGTLESTVYAYSIATRQLRLLTPSPFEGAAPATQGGRVVFAGHVGDAPADLWVWDGTAAPARPVAMTRTHETTPELSGDWAVFVRLDEPDLRSTGRVVARHLVTGEERVLSDGLEGYPELPSIDGTRVAWHQRNEPAGSMPAASIELVDLAGGERRTLARLGHSFVPRVSGDRVCWSTWPAARTSTSAGGSDATVFDLRTSVATTVARNGYACDLDASRAVFLEIHGDVDAYFVSLAREGP